jgi:uncharacterized membrane protein YeaQ/YmgE (transglycosylase-associated protein family)
MRATNFDYWVLGIGLVVGLVARFVVPGRRPLNIVLALALGAAGAWGAVAAATRFALFKPGEHAGLVVAAAGAVALIAVFVALFRRGS